MASRYDEIMKTTPYLPADMGGCLTEAMIAKAKEELGETEEVKAKTIPELRQLVQAEPGFTCPTDDAYLLLHLRARKFDVQKAFSLLKHFYEVKRSNSDMFGSIDEVALKRMLNQKSGFLLPYRDQDGCAIGVIRMRKWDADVTNAAEAITTLAMGVLWCAQEPATQVCGMRVLFDARGTNLKQMKSLIPRQIYLLSRGFTICNTFENKMASSYDEMMKTKPYLPLNMGGRLTEAMIAKAEEELGETEEVKAKTLPELRKLIQAEPGLSCPTDDAFLLQFLRGRKFNVQRAFSLLRNFYKVKKSNEDIYGSFDQEAIMRALDQKISFVLPYRDEEGHAVVLIKMKNWDVDVTNASEAIMALTVGALWAIQEPATQICGVKLLFDVQGTTLKQIRSVIPRHIILLAKAFTNCLPNRFKGIHVYNESPIFKHMISVLKLFLSEKMKNRIHLHGDSQMHMHNSIPKAILPVEDFGGDNPNDIADWFNSEMEAYFEKCREIINHGYRR